MNKYWKQVRPTLPLILVIAAIVIGLGIFVTWLTVPDGLNDRAFYLNIGATIVGLGISIVIVYFLLPTLLDMISLRRIRIVQEKLLIQFEESLISWTINFCILMKCPDNLLRRLHPAMFKLPDKPLTERLPRDIEPNLINWFTNLRSIEIQRLYAVFEPKQWQLIILNIGGLSWRMEYFKQQFLPISVTLPELSDLSFKLIQLLDCLTTIPPADQPFKQKNITPVMCHDISNIGEQLLTLLNDTREILEKTGISSMNKQQNNSLLKKFKSSKAFSIGFIIFLVLALSGASIMLSSSILGLLVFFLGFISLATGAAISFKKFAPLMFFISLSSLLAICANIFQNQRWEYMSASLGLIALGLAIQSFISGETVEKQLTKISQDISKLTMDKTKSPEKPSDNSTNSTKD